MTGASLRRTLPAAAAVVVVAAIAAVVVFAGSTKGSPTTPPADIVVKARGQTDPVAEAGDAADDPAIWVHPDDPAKSLILGTDKKDGLNVYGLDGRLLSTASPGSRPNNVDVVYGFPLNGHPVDLAVAGCRGLSSRGVKMWAIDPRTRGLTDVTAGAARVIPVVAGQDPYGSGVYHSRVDGRFYFFINDKTGRVEQYAMRATDNATIGADLVRTFKLGSQVEGCVADDELGCVYVAEERVGIWKFDAEPGGSKTGELIARVGEHRLTADVEGLAIYAAARGRGYLIASSQGSGTFNLYRRDGKNEFVATMAAGDGPKIDGVSETDGIAVVNCPMGERYPKGLFVTQDGVTPSGRQNFKLFGWEDIAGDRLIVDTTHTVRPARSP
jgi:3-phytase